MPSYELLGLFTQAEGPSRALDAKLAQRLFRDEEHTTIVKDFKYDYAIRHWPDGPSPEYTRVPYYSSSLDAVISAIPEGFQIVLYISKEGTSAQLNSYINLPVRRFGSAKTAPLALCIALASLLGD